MAYFQKPAAWIRLGVVLAAAWLLYEFWVWEVERIEVPPGHFLVRVHLWGKDLPEGQILAPDESYKGVMPDPLPEGRHFLNPLFWSHEMHQMVNVPAGKCLVLTRKYGTEIPPERLASGDFLARDGERGIVREVLLPGNHRINPHAYAWALEDATEVPAGMVGVRTLKVGKDPRTLKDRKNPYVVPEGYRGVQEESLSNGTYYVNPFVEKVVPVQVRSRRVEFVNIAFPSRDGFILKPHVLVTYRVLPEKAPELFVMLTREGSLHQEDATPELQAKNEVLQKVVLPLIRGYVRIEGSKYDARDFISQAKGQPARTTNPRERLQAELMTKVTPRCQDVGIEVESITLGEIGRPADVAEGTDRELAALARQIADREIARVHREKNQSLVEQYQAEQTLKAKEALKEQKAETVKAQTQLKQAEIEAQKNKEVAESKLKQELESARIRLEAAKADAKATLARGKAEADVINLQNEAEVSGLRKAVQGFPSPEHYAQYQVLSKLAPALMEIFASDTSEFAKMFAGYMTAPNKSTVVARPAGGGPPPKK